VIKKLFIISFAFVILDSYSQSEEKYSFDYVDQWKVANQEWNGNPGDQSAKVIFNYKYRENQTKLILVNDEMLFTTLVYHNPPNAGIRFFLTEDYKGSKAMVWFNEIIGMLLIYYLKDDSGLRLIQKEIFSRYLEKSNTSFDDFNNYNPVFTMFEEEVHELDSNVYVSVDVLPEFPGGINGLMDYLASNIQYPKKAKYLGIEGRVFLNFIIEPDGNVSNVSVLKGIGGGCDEEAIRVLEAMPRWDAGTIDGKPVRVSYNLPLKFTLTK
jgi:TonB family protein